MLCQRISGLVIKLLCDFQNFELLDRDERKLIRFKLSSLQDHVTDFSFMMGMERHTYTDQEPVNIKASQLIADLHDELKASGYNGHSLGVFLVRTVYCLFADDTGIC